jgi:hypothetical protein
VVVQDGLEAGEESGDRQRHKEMREHLADFAIEGTLATDPVERLSDGEVTRTIRWRRIQWVLRFTMFVIECTVATLSSVWVLCTACFPYRHLGLSLIW